MNRTWRLLGLSLALWTSPMTRTSQAQLVQPHRGSYWNTQVNRRLDATEKELESAIRQRRELARKVSEATAHAQEKDRELRTTLADIRKEFEQNPQLVQAREESRTRSTTFTNAKEHVLRLLQTSPAYAAALKRRDDIKSDIRDLPSGAQSSQARQELAKALAAAMTEVSVLEDRAIEADSSAADARRKYLAATEELAKLVAQRDRAIDSDPRLQSAKLSREEASRNAQQLRQQLSAANAHIAYMERVYQDLVSQRLAIDRYQQAQRWSGWGGGWGRWHRPAWPR